MDESPLTPVTEESAHPRTFSLAEAAARVGVKPETIRKWVRAGLLAPIPGSLRICGHHRYDERDLTRVESDMSKRGRGRTRRREPAA